MFFHTRILDITILGLILLSVWLAIHLIPFSFWVDVKYVEYDDMKCGDSLQLAHTERYPLWPMKGTFQSQLFRFEDGDVIETTIKRDGFFAYEGDGHVTFEAEWSQPVTQAGTYGVATFREIYPLPFITSESFTPAEDVIFKVVCD